MISSHSKKVVRKDETSGGIRRDRFAQETMTAIGPFPKLFQSIHIERSSPKDTHNTLFIKKYPGISIREGYSQEERIELESSPFICEDMRYEAPYCIRSAPIQFSCHHSDSQSEYKIAGFYPDKALLVIGGVRYRTGKTLTIEWANTIKEIFKYISEGGFKRVKVPKRKLQLGADPEFSLARGSQRVPASEILSGGTSSKIGVDGASHTGEIRPDPCENPILLVRKHIRPLLKQLKDMLPKDVKVTTGGGFRDPLGGHIHFNKKLCPEEVELLDDFIGNPLALMKGGSRPGQDNRRRTPGGNNYGDPGCLRDQPHGSEYRTPPSVLIPELLEAKFVTAFCCVHKWENIPEGGQFVYEIGDGGVPTEESYKKLAPSKAYVPFLLNLRKWALTGEIDKVADIMPMWFSSRCAKPVKFRAIVADPPSWYKGPTRFSVKGLEKNEEVQLKSYNKAYIDEILPEPEEGEEQQTLDKGTVVVELPYSTIEKMGEDETMRDMFSTLISNKIPKSVAAIPSSSDNVSIRYPAGWKRNLKLITPEFIRNLARFTFENQKEER